MSPWTAIAVGALGGAGAVGRALLAGAVAQRTADAPALGTLAVNLTGALLLGVLVGAGAEDDVLRLAGAALLGAYTTFSTWMLDSRRLRARGRSRAAALNVAGSLLLGLGAVWLGVAIGEAL